MCKAYKPYTEFHSNKSTADGYQGACKECMKEYHRKYRERGSRLVVERRYNFKVKYGITLEEYEALLVQQGGCCAICRAVIDPRGTTMPVDHDHETGKVRGILCMNCNVGLGHFHDSVEMLKRAIAYLEEINRHAS